MQKQDWQTRDEPVAVLEPRERVFERAGAHVETYVGLRAEEAGPLDELVYEEMSVMLRKLKGKTRASPELIALLSQPGKLGPARAQLPRTDAVCERPSLSASI
jgi:hypothetical protein